MDIKKLFFESVAKDKVIAAIKEPKHLEKFLESDIKAAFLLTGNISVIKRYGREDVATEAIFNSEEGLKVFNLIDEMYKEGTFFNTGQNWDDKALLPTIQTAYLFTGIQAEAVPIAKKIGANALHCEAEYALSEMGKEAIHNGFPLRVYTVNDVKLAKTLQEAGVTAIFTDFPNLF